MNITINSLSWFVHPRTMNARSAEDEDKGKKKRVVGEIVLYYNSSLPGSSSNL